MFNWSGTTLSVSSIKKTQIIYGLINGY